MRIVDVCVDRFGVLEDLRLEDFSPGLNVVYGGNGSGKTTLVNFVRGLLFGYRTDHQAFQVGDESFGGTVSLRSGSGAYRLARECSHGISSDLSTVDLASGFPVPSAGTQLPAWVNESVYQEIFSVGYQEAARFDLLTRLCLDDCGTVGSPEEIRQVERAVEQCQQEREGSPSVHGLKQQRDLVAGRRGELEAQLADLGRIDPEIPARIRRLETELSDQVSQLGVTDAEIAELRGRIARLEELIAAQQARNTVPLDSEIVQDQMSDLFARQQRWSQIAGQIREQIQRIAVAGEDSWQPSAYLNSIRTLLGRVERRIGESTADNQHSLHGVADPERELRMEHLRSEVFSLCEFVQQHEAAITGHESSVELMLARLTLEHAERVENSLQARINSLRSELVRAEDLTDPEFAVRRTCGSSAHAAYVRGGSCRATTTQSLDELQSALADLQLQLSRLTVVRADQQGRIARLESELADLRGRLRTAASLEDIDALRSQIAQLDAQLITIERRWATLDQVEADLGRVLQRLRSNRDSDVLDLASEYIERLTDGDCYRLTGDYRDVRILAETRQATHPQELRQLSRGTRDLVALALRLALIQCRGEHQEKCPLILDDVFVSADDDGASAAVELLLEVAASGQQIIFLTSQNDVRNLFRSRRVLVRTLGETAEVTTAEPDVQSVQTPVVEPKPLPAAVPESKVDGQSSNWLFYLEVDSSVEDLSGLTVAELEACRAAGVTIIMNLLDLSTDELEERFRENGYAISRDRIRAWRGQAELATLIPMLRRSDAELLFAAGIQTTLELSRMRPEVVYDVVTQFQNSQAGSRFRRSGHVIDRQQAINWSRWSQHTRTLEEARKSRSRYFIDADCNISDVESQEADSGSHGGRGRRLRISSVGTRVRRQPVPNVSSDSRDARRKRSTRRRERMSRRSSSYRTSGGEESDASVFTFYLNRSAEVEEAPSIGPKTAQRLARVGVYTVDDLLNADSETVAENLDNRRINGETIRQWQQQAQLICQIPGLRGHDAQILVACGITEVEQLSAKRPADLYAIVGPFADTTEGERIVRNGRKPDLEEVTDWITWAQHARSLKAAA